MAKKEKFIPKIKSVIKHLEQLDYELNTTDDTSNLSKLYEQYVQEFKYLLENKHKTLNIKDKSLLTEVMARSCLAYARIGMIYKNPSQKKSYFSEASDFGRKAIDLTDNNEYGSLLLQQVSNLEHTLFKLTNDRVHIYNYFESESQIATSKNDLISPKRRREAKDNLSNLIRDQFQEGLNSTDSLALAQRGIFHKRNKDWEIYGTRLI